MTKSIRRHPDPEAPQFQLRWAGPDDAEAISHLIHGLVHYALEGGTSEPTERSKQFFQHVSVAAIHGFLTSDEYRYAVAERTTDRRIVGAVGIRDNNHLYHLWVAEECHGQGLGGRLWQMAKADALERGNPGRFTVKSSLYGVAVYQRFGFRVEGPEVRQDGIVFVPMVLDETARDKSLLS